jgi:hypothetical protein
MRKPSATLALAFLLPVLTTGCLSRFVRDDVYNEGEVRVTLRAEKRWGSTVEKDYDHPATISGVRLAHVFSRLDVRRSVEDGNKRTPAIPTDLLYSVADGVSRALGRAGSEQEVVAFILRKERRFGIFDREFLTSFIAYVRGDELVLHLSRIDWELPERRELDLPDPRIGDHPQKFRIYASDAMRLRDGQTVVVDWRDPIFSRPTRTKVLPTGEVLRKTILLESPPEEAAPSPPSQALPPGLTAEQLRALADLEEARRNGEITEAEYRSQQREVMGAP